MLLMPFINKGDSHFPHNEFNILVRMIIVDGNSNQLLIRFIWPTISDVAIAFDKLPPSQCLPIHPLASHHIKFPEPQ